MHFSLTVGTDRLSLEVGQWGVESSIRLSHFSFTRGSKGLHWVRHQRWLCLDDQAFGSSSPGFDRYY